MKQKKFYEPPFGELLELATPLSLLDTVSTEGDIQDWEQESPIETTEIE